MNDRDVIKKYLTESDIKEQMAEEAAELYKALSKWRRAHENKPGYQVGESEALDMVVEELADTVLCGYLLGTYPMKNVRAPVDVEAAMSNTAELLWTLQSGETAPVKTSMLMGRVFAWAETRGEAGVISGMVLDYMTAKEKRWSARLQRWAKNHPDSSMEWGIDMKPILFNAEMVQAIQDGRKTVTRRVIKPQPVGKVFHFAGKRTSRTVGFRNDAEGRIRGFDIKHPYKLNEILYVRETWAHPSAAEIQNGTDPQMYLYKADYPKIPCAWDCWHPSIHMPREAARIFLRVTDIHPEQLHDIQERGRFSAKDEGFINDIDLPAGTGKSATRHFMDFWESTIKPKDRPIYGREANPWVWVISFERCEKPDEV